MYNGAVGNIKNKNNFDKLLISLVIALAGFGFYLFCLLEGPPNIWTSSFVIVTILIVVGYNWGLLSVNFIVLAAFYVPPLSFLWAYIYGANYINYLNQNLQRKDILVNSSVSFSLVSLLVSLSVIYFFSNKNRFYNTAFFSKKIRLGGFAYFFLTLLFAFMFYLTDPGPTILTTSYEEILKERVEGAQFAGSLGFSAWVIALLIYSSHYKLSDYFKNNFSKIVLDRFFIVASFMGFLWLALHARRSEMAAMVIVWLLFLSGTGANRKAVAYGVISFLLLWVIGEVRSVLYSGLSGSILGGLYGIGSSPEVKSLPGGGSNIFMTYLDIIHLFGERTILYGQTFSNYIFQVFPTFIYQILGISRPDYFYQYFLLGNYEYNGGTYAGAVFYANFGLFGPILFGLFVGAYSLVAQRLAVSRNIGLAAGGLFLVGFVLRGGWYELVTLIKPLLWVFFPLFFIVVVLSNKSNSDGTKVETSDG